MSEPTDEFIKSYTGCQSRLYAFLLSLLGDAEQSREVLQETNLVIWQKCGDFEAGTNFMAWVLRIARFQAMAYRNRQSRDRLIFSEAAQEHIANAFMKYDTQRGERQHLLQHCLKLLPPNAQDLIQRRYQDEQALQQIADETGRTYQAVGQALKRVRSSLAVCIKERELPHG